MEEEIHGGLDRITRLGSDVRKLEVSGMNMVRVRVEADPEGLGRLSE